MSSKSDLASDPPGFERYQRRMDTYVFGPELLLPLKLKAALLEKELQLQNEQDLRDEEARAHAAEARQLLSVNPPAAPSVIDKDAETLLNELQKWENINERDGLRESRSYYPVFKSEQALVLFKSLGSLGDKDDEKRLEKIYRELLQRGTTLRKIARPISIDPLKRIAATQPHMKDVVTFISDQIIMAQRSNKPVRLQPILLAGEPGCGKTYFAQKLAEAFETTFYLQQMDSDLTASFLMGSDRKWGNSQPGILFETLVRGEHANPVFLLDELDKCQRKTSYSTPISSLYSVLEPLSAQRVRDISLLFEFDASMVTWIATANNVTMLDAPLRSRFREFFIMPPSAEECLVLAAEVTGNCWTQCKLPACGFGAAMKPLTEWLRRLSN